ncbi:MAG: RluA family pseudouridine synthase [Duodenibacillus sp.]|nr:RluA family pseudouridine synthase [Duodenibacillus sp.]
MATTIRDNPENYIDECGEFDEPGDFGGMQEAPGAGGSEPLAFELGVSADIARLDKHLASLMPEVSRARVQGWIEDGLVEVDGAVCRQGRVKVGPGARIAVRPRPSPEQLAFAPEDGIAFEVVHEDDAILVINKPAGLVVHPAAGHWRGTLLNGLLHRFPELARVPRAGIVHRLDKETSGLMVVARTEAAQTDLVRQLQARTVGREYWAVVVGQAPEAGFVDRAIGRDPRNPLKFCCRGGAGSRPAVTHCRLVDSARAGGRVLSWVACRLETGRTHQIRVHLSTVGYPLVGDPLYKTNASRLPPEAGLAAAFPRQALHASRLRLAHPATGEACEWFAEPPADMAALMDELGFGPLDEPAAVFD